MKIIVSVLFVGSLALTAACGGKKGSAQNCNDVVDHAFSLLPTEAQEKAAKKRDRSIEKCEAAPIEKRQCILDATDIGALTLCDK